MFSYAFAFIFLLSILILVHELGHFLVAKACGVRVLKFSLGFGPPIGLGRFKLRWVRGDTEYVIACIPLGGFVKMLGENPGGEDSEQVLAHPDETLESKPTWQKLAIVFAGPAMNLLLPIVVFTGTLYAGLMRPEPIVGMVEIGSPAAVAGLVPGDRIVAIDAEPIEWWGDLDDAVRSRPGSDLALVFERDGVREVGELAVATRSGFDEFGSVKPTGWVGLGHARRRAVLGVPDADSAAHRAGLRSGDLVIAVAGEPVEDWEEFVRALGAAGGRVSLELARGLSPDAERRAVDLPAGAEVAEFGIVPASVLVAGVEPGSPAERGGFQKGDLILSVHGEAVGSFGSFAERVRTGGGETLRLSFARGGEVRETSLTPELIATDIGLGIEEPRYRIGIRGAEALVAGALAVDRETNLLVSVPRAAMMTVNVTRTFIEGLGKIVTGEVSRSNLAGPIGIAEIAGNALERGWDTYLSIMVLISINLGILNLLPIPILDGGQAVLFAVEGVRRSPLSLRSREIFQQIGVTVLVMLMGLAFWNDISRNWARVVDWFRSGPGL